MLKTMTVILPTNICSLKVILTYCPYIMLLYSVVLNADESNSSSTSLPKSYSNLFNRLNCTVEYSIQLSMKPDIQHKEDTQFPHTPQSPVLSVGTYQWIELTCTCCCIYSDLWKRITNTQLIQSSSSSASTTSTTHPTTHQPLEHNSNNNNNTETSMTTLLYKITSSNDHVIALSLSKKTHSNRHLHHCDNTTTMFNEGSNYNSYSSSYYYNTYNSICTTLYIEVKCNAPNGFYVHAENLGHSRITTTLIWMNSTSRKQVDMLTKMSDSFGILDDQHYNYDQQSSSSSTTTTTTTSKTTTMTTTTTIVTSPGYMKQHQKQLQQQTQYQLANKLVNNPLDSKQIEITEAGIFVPSSSASDLQYDDNHNNNNNALNGTWKAYLWLTILLRPQKFYLASDWSSAVIAFMLSLSVGCCDDPILVREQLHEPKSILCGILCQSLIIPLLALGIGIVYALDIDQAFGLFMSSTIPAGGLAYLLTYLSHGDRQLSAALSLVSSLCNLVITPIWAMTVGWYWFNRPINIGKTFGWLLLIAGAQSLGTLMRGCRPGLARAILTWVTRPLLLLSGILLVTLGVYINHYAFNEVTQSLILALLTLITCGFAVGWLVGILIKQGCTGSRTLSTASSVFNGLICMPMLRTCVHAPEGDLAAVVALWTIFFAPIPLAYHAAVTIMEKWLTSYLQNRRKKREEENCMAAMIGGKQHEFSATSVAAVAAAAIAVTPAIAAGNQHRTSKSKTSTTYSQETMNNDDYNGINSPPITTTTTTAKKTSSDTVTTPTSSMDHPLEYDNYLDTCGLHGVHNVYNDHFKPIDDNELRLSILAANNEIMLNSYKHRPPTVFEGQQTRVRRANWLTDPNQQQQQQQPEEVDESAETEHLRTSHLNDRVNADSRMSITHNNSEVISEQQQQQQQNDGEDPSKTRKTGLKRSSVQPTVKNVAEKDHRHSVHVSPPYTNL